MPVPCPKAETETLQRVTVVPRTSCTYAALDDVATRPGQSPLREYVYAPSRELRGEAEAIT